MITAQNLRKSFSDGIQVLDGLDFSLNQGEVCSIVGPTGCGKTTLLNIMAGLEFPDNRKSLSIPKSNRQDTGYMMQDDQLLPWRTLQANATLGYEVIWGYKPSALEIKRWLESFGLWAERNKYPHETSGGMKQRIALIRTCLFSPTLLLLDEPFSSLDFDIKLRVQKSLLAYQERLDATLVLVTHDIEDAIGLSDRVIVLSNKPARIKLTLDIDLGLLTKDPVDARKSPKFRDYFVKIWDELKYLDDRDES